MLENNYFFSNEALSEGGVIKWIEIKPEIDYSRNFFFKNMAPYGSIIAGFPFRIEMEYFENEKIICPNDSRINCYTQLFGLSSGSPLNISLAFSIKDIYNNSVSSINSG